MAALGAIPVLLFIAASAALLSVRAMRDTGRPVRESLLIASVAWALWLVLGTEAFSVAGSLKRIPLLLWWGLPLAPLAGVAGVAWARARRKSDGAGSDGPPAARRRPDGLTAALLGGVILVLLATALIAAATPPNNWDSQVYHLPRQVHWMQQGSVAHYPTYQLRQIMMPPLAEYGGLHFMILTGGDAWANLIQWFALAMTAGAVSLIARELGAGGRGQSLAALLVVANPMAAMQAMNTKNDVVLALWTCAMAYFVLTVWTRRACPPGRAALIGACLGLMLLTKGTGFIFALPISAACAVAILTVQRWRGLLTGAAIGAIALAINAGHAARNMQDFGSPVGPSAAEGGFPLFNEIHTPAAIVSGIVRNLALHAGTPNDDINSATTEAIGRLHEWIGIDPSDRRTTYQGQRFRVVHRPKNEDETPAPAHLALAVLVVPVMLAIRRRDRLTLVAAMVPLAAFLLFCILLTWQPWHARLHVPIVCLLAPVAAVLLERLWRGVAAAATGAAALLVVAPSILWGVNKPLLGSPSVFTATWAQNVFRSRPELIEPLACVVEAVVELEPKRIAILRVDDQWIYPFQRALLRESPSPPLFVDLHNHPSQSIEALQEPPDLIIHTDGRALRFIVRGTPYVPVAHCGAHTVYLTSEAAAARSLAPPAPPPFIGWSNVQKLGRPEGPHPQWNLPVVRWGLGPATTFSFHSDGEPMTLILEARRNDSPDQTMVVRLNGSEVSTHAFGEDRGFQTLRVPLEPAPGNNQLVLEYEVWDESGQRRPTAVLFSRIQILPTSLVERSAREESDAG